MWADLWSGVYFTLAVVGVEAARRGFRAPSDVTRKAALFSIGVWAIPAFYLYSTPARAALPFLFAALVLYLSFRFEILAGVEDDGAGIGSVLAPLSAAALLFFVPSELAHVSLAAILALSAGDGAAAIVGRRLGTKRFRVRGHGRSMEGTLAFFFAAGASQAIVLAAVGGLDPHRAVAFALIAATVAAVVEAVSVYGSDNVTVPLAAALTLLGLVTASQ